MSMLSWHALDRLIIDPDDSALAQFPNLAAHAQVRFSTATAHQITCFVRDARHWQKLSPLNTASAIKRRWAVVESDGQDALIKEIIDACLEFQADPVESFVLSHLNFPMALGVKPVYPIKSQQQALGLARQKHFEDQVFRKMMSGVSKDEQWSVSNGFPTQPKLLLFHQQAVRHVENMIEAAKGSAERLGALVKGNEKARFVEPRELTQWLMARGVSLADCMQASSHPYRREFLGEDLGL